jgi:hypothetical protein
MAGFTITGLVLSVSQQVNTRTTKVKDARVRHCKIGSIHTLIDHVNGWIAIRANFTSAKSEEFVFIANPSSFQIEIEQSDGYNEGQQWKTTKQETTKRLARTFQPDGREMQKDFCSLQTKHNKTFCFARLIQQHPNNGTAKERIH